MIKMKYVWKVLYVIKKHLTNRLRMVQREQLAAVILKVADKQDYWYQQWLERL